MIHIYTTLNQIIILGKDQKEKIEINDKEYQLDIEKIKNDNEYQSLLTTYPFKPYFGIINIITLNQGIILYLVKSIEALPTFDNKTIHKITSVETIFLMKSTWFNKYILFTTNLMINNESFYYLENGDLTSEGLKSGMNGKGYQPKFQFNKGLLGYFSWEKFHNFSNIIISGYIEILTEIIDKDNTLNYCLISKRSNRRIGIRLIERGMDLLGNCSNTIETEQIIHYKNKKYNFITIRGHVPLFWYQNNFEVINSIQLIQNNESKMFNAFEKHIQKIDKNGKQLILINLLKDNGNEKILSAKYQDYCNKKELNYFHLKNHLEIKNYIEGLNSYSLNELLNLNFRLNCKSCIDRTNGFQYQLNQLILKKIIQDNNNNNNNNNNITILSSSFYKKYQQCWINNGDNLSKLYNDTNCIKKYMTSSPQDNSIIELMWISIKRKVYSYFYHGYKFDGYQFYFINNLNNNNNNNQQQQYQKYNLIQLFNFSLFNFTIYLLLTILNYIYKNNNSIINMFLSTTYTLTLFFKKPITSIFIDKSNDN